MTISTWDEIRTAYHVARLGTVSGAADVLGVHHATVIRHIDALEKQLGVKLFQRHARGYAPTEAGADLLQVAQATDDQFAQLAGRIRGRGDKVTGELVVTSLTALSPRLTPVLAAFQAEHPGLTVRFLTGERVLRLEYGEAHVAVRAGPAPEQPDNVVQAFGHIAVGLYAARSYVAARGTPKQDADLPTHHFVTTVAADRRAPYYKWLAEAVPEAQFVFRANDQQVLRDAVVAGAGIGFLAKVDAQSLPDLVEVMAPRPEWSAPLWLVTHVDLHRTTKVQAALSALKAAATRWDT